MRGFLVLVVLALLQWAAAAGALHGGGPSSGEGPAASRHLCVHPCAGQSLARASAQAAGESVATGAATLAAGESVATGAATLAQDCASCHAHCNLAMLAAASTLIDPAGRAQAGYAEKSIQPSWQERPYRPQWRAPTDRG